MCSHNLIYSQHTTHACILMLWIAPTWISTWNGYNPIRKHGVWGLLIRLHWIPQFWMGKNGFDMVVSTEWEMSLTLRWWAASQHECEHAGDGRTAPINGSCKCNSSLPHTVQWITLPQPMPQRELLARRRSVTCGKQIKKEMMCDRTRRILIYVILPLLYANNGVSNGCTPDARCCKERMGRQQTLMSRLADSSFDVSI